MGLPLHLENGGKETLKSTKHKMQLTTQLQEENLKENRAKYAEKKRKPITKIILSH
jgi:hypothetical protein